MSEIRIAVTKCAKCGKKRKCSEWEKDMLCKDCKIGEMTGYAQFAHLNYHTRGGDKNAVYVSEWKGKGSK